MTVLENLASFASLVTAVIAALSFGWRWHTTRSEDRSRFVDVLDVAVLLIATVAAGISLWSIMGGDLESIIIAAWLAFGIAVAAVILSGLAVFALRKRRANRPAEPSGSAVQIADEPAAD